MSYITHRLPFFGWMALLVGVTGMQSCSNGGQKSDTPVEVPAGFSVMFGQGGGIAGRWAGYTLQPDGQLMRWEGRYAEEKMEPALQLTAGQVGALWTCFENHGFFEVDREEYGNQTALIRVTTEADTHRVAWKPVVREGPTPWTPLDSLYFEVQDLVRDALEHQKAAPETSN